MPTRVLLVLIALALGCGPAAAEKKSTRPQGKERLQCKVGPYEKQTRLVMETTKGKPVYLAYWSSNGPYHCSFESWPGDGRATWRDSSAGMVISLISGTLLIHRQRDKKGDRYIITAREVDRMQYCGTDGVISGVLTVPRRGQCTWVETSDEVAAQIQ